MINIDDQILECAAEWIAFYRANPHRFAKDYLHLDLRAFQQELLYMMNWSEKSSVIASRGAGKSYILAIYCVIRAILYPGSKIVIAAGVRSQSMNVLDKIMLELKPESPELAAEINEKETTLNGTRAQIVFKNTSYIKVVTAADSSRSNRANILVLDEFRMISKEVIDTVLRKFLTQQRTPRYSELSLAERKAAWDKEPNATLACTSAWYAEHWSYQFCLDIFNAMVEGKRQFICGLPYQISLKEGLIAPNAIRSEIEETDFNELRFMMEYEAIWYGATDGSFFDYNSIAKNRRIKYPMLPNNVAMKLNNSKTLRIQPKANGEKRILSADIALMSSGKNKNDATAIFINQLMPTKAGRYVSNIVYTENCEGLRTDAQALIIRRLFDEYDCDYLVLDTNGIGLGVYDALAQDIIDPDSGEIYPAISCCNNDEMAKRCVVPGADRVIWSIKASANFNSQCAYALRDGFKNGRIRLLCNDSEGEEYLQEIAGFKNLSVQDKAKLLAPYINTNLLIDEIIKLQYQESDGRVRVYERSGMRKDRYSSLAYNYYVANQIETKLRRKHSRNAETQQPFIIRAPQYNVRGGRSIYGSRSQNNWYS